MAARERFVNTHLGTDMQEVQKRVSMTRQELVAFHLRTLALRVDPRNGHLSKLADEISVHSTRVTAWINQGYVPMFQVRKLQKMFGKKHVPVDELCPPEHRAN